MNTRNTLILGLAGVIIFYLLYKQEEFDTSSYLQEIETLQQQKNQALITVGKLKQEKVKDSLEDLKKENEYKQLQKQNIILDEKLKSKVATISTLPNDSLQRAITNWADKFRQREDSIK